MRIGRLLPAVVLVGWVLSACAPGAPEPVVPAASTVPQAASPVASQQPSDTPAPSLSPTSAASVTPTLAPTVTPLPIDRVISPKTLGQLQGLWKISEPGKGNFSDYSTCQDVACWLPYRIGSSAFSPDGKTLAVGVCLGDPTENITNPRHYRFNCKDGSEIRLFDVQTGSLEQSLAIHDFPLSISFHPDGKTLAVGLSQRDTALFDLETGELFRTLPHSTKRTGVAWLTFTPDGTRLLTYGDDNLQVWDWQTPLLVETLRRVGHPSLSQDGNSLATLYHTDQKFWRVRIYKMEALPDFTELRMKEDVPGSLGFTPDEGLLFIVGAARIEIWDPVTREQIRFYRAGDTSIPVYFDMTSQVTQDGYLLVVPWDDDTDTILCGLGLWRPREQGIYLARPPEEACWEPGSTSGSLTSNLRTLQLSPDGKFLAAGYDDGSLVLWGVDAEAAALETVCLGSCGP